DSLSICALRYIKAKSKKTDNGLVLWRNVSECLALSPPTSVHSTLPPRALHTLPLHSHSKSNTHLSILFNLLCHINHHHHYPSPPLLLSSITSPSSPSSTILPLIAT